MPVTTDSMESAPLQEQNWTIDSPLKKTTSTKAETDEKFVDHSEAQQKSKLSDPETIGNGTIFSEETEISDISVEKSPANQNSPKAVNGDCVIGDKVISKNQEQPEGTSIQIPGQNEGHEENSGKKEAFEVINTEKKNGIVDQLPKFDEEIREKQAIPTQPTMDDLSRQMETAVVSTAEVKEAVLEQPQAYFNIVDYETKGQDIQLKVTTHEVQPDFDDMDQLEFTKAHLDETHSEKKGIAEANEIPSKSVKIQKEVSSVSANVVSEKATDENKPTILDNIHSTVEITVSTPLPIESGETDKDSAGTNDSGNAEEENINTSEAATQNIHPQIAIVAEISSSNELSEVHENATLESPVELPKNTIPPEDATDPAPPSQGSKALDSDSISFPVLSDSKGETAISVTTNCSASVFVTATPVTISPSSTKTDKMSTASTPTKTPPSPTAPPRRPSSAILNSNTLSSQRSYGSGKLFNSSLNVPRGSPVPVKEEANRKKKKGMFSWLGGDSSKKKNKEVLESVSDGLRKIYKQKLYPLEEYYKFHDFHSPALDDPDFDAKPMILLVGQYSTGKTTFIRYLLEQDFPGIRIGPEPTTDRFIAVMHGEEEGVIPGNALVVDAKKQFRALSGFGNAFLNRFQCSTLPNQVLESITIVDTPGILSGEKQRVGEQLKEHRIDRGYDFTGVLEWFAERVDRIILLFDAHKLDISDEFKRCIEALGGNEDKIRIVLNKSDMVDHQQLMRVYGALMWSLGKVFRTPEVSRVYLGSFWDKPLTYDINRRLFVDEQHDLFQDLQALPRNAALRKLNDLIKRARLAKVHAYIISELRKQMPSMIGKDKKKKELIQNLDKIFEQIQREHNISPGDFPDIQKMREKLQNQDFTKFNPLKPKLLEVVDGMLASDIARLMAQIPKEEQAAQNESHDQPTVRGGAFAQAAEAETPFGFGRGEGFDKGADEKEWVVSRERTVADTTFESLGPVNGFLSGRAAKDHMVKSKLPNPVLGKIWKLADVDQDGQLDADEFALANYLINLKLEGHELPAELPAHLIPPSKREKEAVYPNLDEQ